jgi:hypothetical protein
MLLVCHGIGEWLYSAPLFLTKEFLLPSFNKRFFVLVCGFFLNILIGGRKRAM